jgi:cytochrome P450
MNLTMTTPADLFAQVLDPANRPNPYPLYAQLREAPVARLNDQYYAVSTHAEIAMLLHDPRAGHDVRKTTLAGGVARLATPSFLFLDPPEHDRLRQLVMHQFTPARVGGMRPRIVALVDELLDAQRGHSQLDVVDDLAYPLPVTVICELLGVPREDAPRFQGWADTLAHSVDPDPGQERTEDQMRAFTGLGSYMGGLLAERRTHPQDDLLSGLAVGNDPAGHMDDGNLVINMILLLIAGHETTINWITNGMLTLLRHPEVLERLRVHPESVPGLVEEILRYEPSVQFTVRYALADIPLAGVTIPKGAGIYLLLAAGNRDPQFFSTPDRFDPGRPNNQHFGFGGGIHYCVGAPLARMETQLALTALARRLVNPRLVVDPPPYRPNAILRGPRHLPVAFDRMAD